jgi:hypothetical protein
MEIFILAGKKLSQYELFSPRVSDLLHNVSIKLNHNMKIVPITVLSDFLPNSNVFNCLLQLNRHSVTDLSIVLCC